MANGGLTLSEIDALSMEDVNRIFGYWNGEAKAMKDKKWLSG